MHPLPDWGQIPLTINLHQSFPNLINSFSTVNYYYQLLSHVIQRKNHWSMENCYCCCCCYFMSMNYQIEKGTILLPMTVNIDFDLN